MTIILQSLGLVMPTMLLFAALSKAFDLVAFEMALVRLLPSTIWRFGVSSRSVARIVFGVELAAVGVIVYMHMQVNLPMALLFTLLASLFLGIVIRSYVLHVNCGCFLERRPSERRDIARSFLTLVTCTAYLANREVNPSAGTSWQSVVIGCVVAILLIAAFRHPTSRLDKQAVADHRLITVNHWLSYERFARLHSLPVSTVIETRQTAMTIGAVLSSREEYAGPQE